MMDRVKKDISDFHKYNSLLKLTISFLVFFVSIGYSALNSSLMVTGDLVYRTKEDIRITGIRINGVTNGGIEQYSPKFTKNTVSLGMKLPNLNSTVTYEVTIKNSSSDKYLISSITDKIPGNPNISYTHNYTNTTIGVNSTTTVLLTYKYNSSVTTLPSNILKETTTSFTFEKAPSTLYEKIKFDYDKGKNVELYTGDKSTFLGDKEVYYYKGATTNNNVIFADACWQIFRTTETGGVKMIYNGLPDSNGRCTSTGSASTIGSQSFNSNYNSPTYVGYMYNKVYTVKQKPLNTESVGVDGALDLSRAEYNVIGNDITNPYTFDSTTKKWTSNNHTDGITSTIEFSVGVEGEYYFNYQVSSEFSCDKGTVYVDGIQKGQYSGEASSSLSLGTLTTSNVVKVVYSKDAGVSNGTDNIVFSMRTTIDLSAISEWKYGNSFTYSGGSYTLVDAQAANLSTDYVSLTNRHYTCFNTSGTCTTLSYVYYVSGTMAFYIDLTGGTSIEKALDEMLYGNNINTINSSMKNKIDKWYKDNMTGYTGYLEDAVWCNDRSVNNKNTNGWNPNGGSMTEWLNFNSSGNINNLTCQNINDRFTVSSTNGNGKLTYPVGLVTRQEAMLAYSSENSSIQNWYDFWTLSPSGFYDYDAGGFRIAADGDWRINDVINLYGVRPAVSLRAGVEYSSGVGSTENPYKIETPDVVSVDRKLYQKVKSDYENGGNVELYTGDKSTFLGDKDVYYYKGATTNNNVLFAGFCWKMFRTTETGGVKMIYNGVPDNNGQCNNTGDASTIGSGAFNTTINSPADVGYMYNKRYTFGYRTVSSRYLYGNSFTYSSGTYTLTNTRSVTLSSSNYTAILNNSHYTCFNTSGTCTTLSYVYYVSNISSGLYVYYINLTGGTSIEKALNEMLYDDNVNTTNSKIKTKIDMWYENNMVAYTSYLEDTIWCNDRSVYDLGGWNPNGGSVASWVYFKSAVNANNLTCQNKNDRFTVSSTNGNGKLTYPVGLVTRQEQNLAYYSSNSPIQNNGQFWTLSPYCFDNTGALGIYVSGGSWFQENVNGLRGARPTVSLKTGIEYKSGDGSSEDPFMI